MYNPAWPTETKTLVIGGGLRRLGATIGYATDSSEFNNQIVIPNYLMGITRYGKWIFQAGYREFYNTKLRYEIAVTVLPEGNKRLVEHYENNRVNEFFVGINRKLGPHLNFGAQSGLLYQYASGTVDGKVVTKGHGYGYTFLLGLNYRPVQQFGMALTYRYASSIDYDVDSELMYNVGSSLRRSIRFPWFLDAGLYYVPLKWIEISLKTEFQEWKKVMDSLNNRLQLAVGLKISPAEHWALHTGYFTSGRYLNGENSLEDVAFITGGISYKIRSNLIFTLSALTSHFFAGKMADGLAQLDQTEILMGIRFEPGNE